MSLTQFTSVLSMIAPVVFMLVPGGAYLAPLVPLLVKSIADAQATKKTGPEKRAYVITMVENAANASNIVKPGTIDTNLAKEAAGHGVDAIITTINAIETAHAALPNAPTVAPAVSLNVAKK